MSRSATVPPTRSFAPCSQFCEDSSAQFAATDRNLDTGDMGKASRLRGERGDDVRPKANDSPQSEPFDSSVIATELAHARVKSRNMLRGTLGMFGPRNELTQAHLPVLGFIERAQAFHLGVIAMIEAGNPLSAATLLRSFAENLAAAFYVSARPSELEKLQPGAQQGLPMGKVVAQAEKNLPGFKAMYDELSNRAHPSGAGAFQTLRFTGERTFTWQSYPTFKDVDDALGLLRLLDELGDLTALVIRHTVQQVGAGASPQATDKRGQ